MSETDPVISGIESALAADPGNTELRAHLAELLVGKQLLPQALAHAEAVLATHPANLTALRAAATAGAAVGDPRAASWQTMADALGGATHQQVPPPQPPQPQVPQAPHVPPAPAGAAPPPWEQQGHQGQQQGPSALSPDELSRVTSTPDSPEELLAMWDDTAAPDEPEIGELSDPGISFADVGGMVDVKARLEISFLSPMRNPEMREAFGKSMRGGLLLWGPPGCGKTFMARACAGELGASFYAIGLSDVLDMYIGQSEKNLSAIFEVARRNTPCVLFFDEIDAIGQKRTQLRASAMRGAVNQFLQELDGVGKDNEGIFVLGATNHPWDIDSALLRPGRFDRMMLVLPPDLEARQSVLAYHLRGRPQENLDIAAIAKKTDGYSGADLSLIAETATERAMTDSISSGTVSPITNKDLKKAASSVKPSTGPWLETARNYALYSNDSGQFDDLLAYMKRKR